MRNSASRRRWNLFRPAILFPLIFVGVLALLWALGAIDPIRLGLKPSMAGLIRVPMSPVAIPAYTKVSRDHLWDAQKTQLSVLYLRREQISPEMLTDIKKIVGRVLNHEKAAGYIFTDADFFPPGTRPGLVAGIPPGKRAMRVDAEKVHGLYGLMPGDRFDLVATLPIDANRASQGLKLGGVYGQQLDLQARMTNWQKQATVRVMVQNGLIVEPMTTRQVPVFSRTLTQGPITRTKPVQEIVIAVDPHEVAHLTEAIAVDAEISCVPRSGRPDDPEDSRTPDLQPWSPFSGAMVATGGPPPIGVAGGPAQAMVPALTTIESISGTKREVMAAPVRR